MPHQWHSRPPVNTLASIMFLPLGGRGTGGGGGRGKGFDRPHFPDDFIRPCRFRVPDLGLIRASNVLNEGNPNDLLDLCQSRTSINRPGLCGIFPPLALRSTLIARPRRGLLRTTHSAAHPAPSRTLATTPEPSGTRRSPTSPQSTRCPPVCQGPHVVFNTLCTHFPPSLNNDSDLQSKQSPTGPRNPKKPPHSRRRNTHADDPPRPPLRPRGP